MRIRTRLLLLFVGQTLLIVIAVLGMYIYSVRSKAHQASLQQARSTLDLAEAVRENMAEKWHLGVFEQQDLQDWAKENKVEQILGTVPIVAAWRASMSGADSNGYIFRTPAFDPRNPENTPNKLEAVALQQFEADPDLKEWVINDSENDSIRYFRPIRLSNDCMVCHGDPATSKELWANDKGLDPTGNKMEGWKTGKLHGAFEVVQSLEPASKAAYADVRFGFMILMTLGATLAGIFAWILRKQVTVPIGNVLQRLHNQAEELKRASVSLNSTASQLSADAEECRSRSTTVAAAAEEMSTSVEEMARSSGRLSDNVESVDSAIMQLKSLAATAQYNVNEALRVTSEAVNMTRQSTDQIRNLGLAANEIDTVSKMISDIAGQTNLLALNATIEAARAGSQGQGFAVVANEVKLLAQQTAKATQDIRRKIDAIQVASRSAVDGITGVEAVIQQVDSASQAIAQTFEQQCMATESIASSMAEATSYAKALKNNTNESAIATREVSGSITVVDSRAQKNWENARQTRAEGELLASIATDIDRVTSSINV